MMDCLEAQNAISDALDGVPVDPEVLDVAKDHCRVCPECASFVRGLSIVKRAPLPAPPHDLADRVMAEVRAEAHATAEAAAAAAAFQANEPESAALPLDSTAALPAEKPTDVSPRRQIQWKSSPAAWAWMAAAVVFVAAVMVVTVNGVKIMTGGSTSSEMQVTDMKAPAAVSDQALSTEPSSATEGASVATQAAGAPNYITVGGNVYKLSSTPGTATASTLSAVGQTTSALDGTTPVPRTVLRGKDGNVVYIQADPQTLLAFTRVVRTYDGHTYGLMSQELAQYGAWPTLPSGIPVPTSPDGAPTFAPLGADANGITVYRLTSGTSGSGIAVAPSAPGDDPSAGNPNWTWWTLLP